MRLLNTAGSFMLISLYRKVADEAFVSSNYDVLPTYPPADPNELWFLSELPKLA